MKYSSDSVVSTPEILKRKLGGELIVPITCQTTSTTASTLIKAGSPLDATGKIANDATAVGILLNDVEITENPNGALVKAFATINEANAKDNSNITLTSVCKEALSNLVFA